MLSLENKSENESLDFIPASNEPSAALARAFGECREGQIPRPLGRCKFDAPLLAAGYLTLLSLGGEAAATYIYDTLGNLVLEKAKNKVVDYQYNGLNRLEMKYQ